MQRLIRLLQYCDDSESSFRRQLRIMVSGNYGVSDAEWGCKEFLNGLGWPSWVRGFHSQDAAHPTSSIKLTPPRNRIFS
jgi:hypothetical protein